MIPFGLINLGMSCWWNSVLQILLHNPVLCDDIMRRPSAPQAPLHQHLQALLYFINKRDPYETYNCHVRLYKCVLDLHPTFREQAMNDAHEVLTYILNRLHEESCYHVEPEMRPTHDAGRAIFRDFDNKLSHILHNVITCTRRTTSDNTELIETFVTLFLEPKLTHNNVYSIDDALNDLRFAYLPSCLFLSLITNGRNTCQFNSHISVQGMKYRLHSMVFFIPSASHYVSAVSTEFVDCSSFKTNDVPDWMLCNDNQISFVSLAQIADYISDGYPTVVSYVQEEA